MLRRLVSYSHIYKVCMSPALNGSLAIRRFKHRDEIEICDGIIDFYTGLSHTYVRFLFFFCLNYEMMKPKTVCVGKKCA